jgi:hypothetical protein
VMCEERAARAQASTPSAAASTPNPFADAMESMAVVSTVHITPQTLERVDALMYLVCYGDETAGGTFIYVPCLQSAGQPAAHAWPTDLVQLMQAANEHGVVWLKMDPDGMEIDRLPRYDEQWNQAKPSKIERERR